MLSSFIALAAGTIGAMPVSAQAPASPPQPPAVVSDQPAPQPAGPVAAAPVRVAPAPSAPLIPVQGDAQSEAPAGPAAGGRADVDETAPAGESAVEPPRRAAPEPLMSDPTLASPTERRAILKAAANALSRVETARGRFVQLDVNGQLSEGDFALQRPGRMRFDYDDPVPYLMASDGTTVAWRDEELEQVDRVPLSSTPLKLLLDDAIDFEDDAEILRVQKDRGQIAITMRDRSGESEDELTLIFESASYALAGWRVLDANGGITQVQLRNIQTGVRLSPRLFIVEDFEDEEDDRRR